MSSVVRWSTSFRLLVVALAAGLLALAALRLPSTSVDVLPEFTPP